ncbi:uncharacterized protein LOC134239941 [Saccostrea cucullata]|uniref:uncharacterized protein LOC134239941 n=1 Tax=Saccostrea cuccullata TaxID=36930 RepID=UPI002ED34209
MASKNIAQMTEKKVWRKSLNCLRSDNYIREDSDVIFENFSMFIELENRASLTLDQLDALDQDVDYDSPERGLKENVQSSEHLKDSCSGVGFSSTVQGDEGGSAIKAGAYDAAFDNNIDEIDYFDKEEEYMETHGLRFDVEDVSNPYEDSSKSINDERMGQYKDISIYRRSIQNFATTNHFEIHDVSPDGNSMFRALADQFMINGRIGFTAERLRCSVVA